MCYGYRGVHIFFLIVTGCNSPLLGVTGGSRGNGPVELMVLIEDGDGDDDD
jgi:hypothetical protein